jgi:hypothetical protein
MSSKSEFKGDGDSFEKDKSGDDLPPRDIVDNDDAKQSPHYRFNVEGAVHPDRIFTTLQEVLAALGQCIINFNGVDQISNIRRDGAAVQSFWDLALTPGIYTMTVTVIPIAISSDFNVTVTMFEA